MNKILLVDDEVVIRQALSKNLQRSGYEVTTAANSEEALVYLDEQQFDIIVTDYLMGGINGVELMNKAKKVYPKIKVIVFSGYIEENLAEKVKDVDCFLSKPIGLDDLLDNIEKLLNS